MSSYFFGVATATVAVSLPPSFATFDVRQGHFGCNAVFGFPPSDTIQFTCKVSPYIFPSRSRWLTRAIQERGCLRCLAYSYTYLIGPRGMLTKKSNQHFCKVEKNNVLKSIGYFKVLLMRPTSHLLCFREATF
jgi:hypothetical protein